MRVLKLAFPVGAIMTIGGVFLYAQLEWLSFENTQDLEFGVLSQILLPVLLLGTALTIVGSFLDRKRLTVRDAKVRGLICWLVSGVCFMLYAAIGNVHGWTFAFIFPTFAGFVAGIVFLWRLLDTNPTAKSIPTRRS